MDENGAVVREHLLPSPGPWPEMRDTIVSVVKELQSSVPEVHALGVGAAGMVDLDGMIHYAPNVPGFRKVPVRAALAERTGLPTIVDNDANTAAYAELKTGVAKGMRDALVITLGTGIGGGVIVNGGVLRGANGFAAEIGHFQIDPAGPMCACGEVGHWEAMASGNALGRMARERAAAGEAPSLLELVNGHVDLIDGPHVSAAAHAGEPDALALVDQYSFNVAIGLVGLANIFDPAVIAISGGLVTRRRPVPRPDAPSLPRPHRGRGLPHHARDRAGRGGRARRGDRRRVARVGPHRERGGRMRLGLTLPSFVEDPDGPLEVARAAEAAGLHGVFVYDHLFRTALTGEMRPALECAALLGAVAAETERISIGTLVARGTLRPPAQLAAAMDTVLRIAGPRVLVGVGAGDEQSRGEMETFGFDFGSEADRVMALRRTLRALRDRGYPVWVGGRARHVGLLAAEGADGWNRWGVSVETFAREADEVGRLVGRLAARRGSSHRRGVGSSCSAAPRPKPKRSGRSSSSGRRSWSAAPSGSRSRCGRTSTPAPAGSPSGRSTRPTPRTPPSSAKKFSHCSPEPTRPPSPDAEPPKRRGRTRPGGALRGTPGCGERQSRRRWAAVVRSAAMPSASIMPPTHALSVASQT